MSIFSSPFAIKKTKQRKQVSRSPLKLPADEMYRELGPRCGTIDVRVADKIISYDTQHGDWNTAEAETVAGRASSGAAQNIRKQITVLKEEQNMLKVKVEVLLNLVAESVAEFSAK